VTDFWSFFWLMVWWFVFISYLMVLFYIISDLFRDHTLSGWLKALWIIGLIIFPFVVALIYLIARGRSMTERSMAAAAANKKATDQYIQSVAAQSSPADEIASAKQLLDSGAITQAEFDHLKSKALAKA
jgi:type VI protein secretion system component VasK